MSDDLLQQVKVHGAVPAHIAIIMDGNGRWAKGRSLPRPLGHHAGMTAVREVIGGCLDADVGVLTLFAFSQENWQRPVPEIEALMRLLEEYIARELENLRERGVSVRILGDIDRLRAECTPSGRSGRRGDRRRRDPGAQSLHLLQLARRDHPRGPTPGGGGGGRSAGSGGHRRGRA